MTTKRALTVSLSPAPDADAFSVGAARVARVLRQLGVAVTMTGFVGEQSGPLIVEELQGNGIETAFELIEGPLHVSPAEAERFVARFRALLPTADCVILSGALPPGLAADFYADLVSICWRQTQVRTIVDAQGPALAGALGAKPYLVKPNRAELAAWAGRPLSTEADVLDAARALGEAGPLLVAASLGADGLLFVGPEDAWRAFPPQLDALNTVGSGDALIAGLVAGLLREESAEGILRLAVACGTANALTPGVAEVSMDDVERIERQVVVTRVPLVH